MDCYLCDKEATRRCSRCGNPYCGDHGEDPSAGSGQALCSDCLNPVNAAPSGTYFRLAVLALLVGSVLTLWFLIRPPGLPGESSGVIIPQASPQSSPEGVTPEPAATPSPETPVAGATAEPTPTPTPTEEPEGPLEYTVVDGDSWNLIADSFGVDAEELAAANGRTLDDFVVTDEVIIIPQ